MMANDFLTDVEISKAFEGASGEGEFGPWTAYNFYVEGDERKFSWFKSDSKPITPVQGMGIKLMDYVSAPSKCGKYINNNVSRIILHGDAHKKAETTKAWEPVKVPLAHAKPGRDSSITFYLGYSARFMSALIANGSGWNEAPPETIADLVVDMGIRMYDRAKGEPDKATSDAEVGFLDAEYEGIRDDEPPPHTDNDIPI